MAFKKSLSVEISSIFLSILFFACSHIIAFTFSSFFQSAFLTFSQKCFLDLHLQCLLAFAESRLTWLSRDFYYYYSPFLIIFIVCFVGSLCYIYIYKSLQSFIDYSSSYRTQFHILIYHGMLSCYLLQETKQMVTIFTSSPELAVVFSKP